MRFKNALEIGLKRILNNDEIKNNIMDAIKNPVQRAIVGNKIFKKLDETKFKEILMGDGAVKYDMIEESIILCMGRPVLEIQNDRINVNDQEIDYWKDVIDEYKDKLVTPIQSVGRIEVTGHPMFDWIGTGWVVAENIIITNRHVANELAQRKGNQFLFNHDFLGNEYKVNIDFKEEYRIKEQAEDYYTYNNKCEFMIKEVIHIEPPSGYDMAFMRIDWNNKNNARPPICLSKSVKPDKTVAVIGYPAHDSRTSLPEEQKRIFSGIYDVKRFAPGEIDSVDTKKGLFQHDCSTAGGCSGSPVIDLETQKVLGLHFGGNETRYNIAISGDIIKQKLEQISRPAPVIKSSFDEEFVYDQEKFTISDMKGRKGYDADFLYKFVPMPGLSNQLQHELAQVTDNDNGMLNYRNYSVLMHKKRRMAIVAAVNIDGKKWRNIPRVKDDWQFDPRIEKTFQIGNELYKKNDLDRGHLVRRLDPAWGETFDDAEKASLDTFFYTNCSPQHKNLNQKTWLGLEDYILRNTDDADMRISVFNGPVFSDDDMSYRGVQIPKSYWKVVAANHPSEKDIYATAYMLSQGEWIDNLEFMFGTYRTFQVPLMKIEEITGLDFGILKDYDPLKTTLESIMQIMEINDMSKIILK